MLPAAGTATLELPLWWVGLFYVTFPLNLLVYGWNDAVDIETDARNPRKDSWFFGARGTESQLARLPKWIVFCQLPFVALFSYVSGLTAALFFGGMVLINVYTIVLLGLLGKPPFDLIAPMGYLLVVVLGSALSQVSSRLMGIRLSRSFLWPAQLMGQVMDIEPDKAAGRCTTATAWRNPQTRSSVWWQPRGLWLVWYLMIGCSAVFIGDSTGLGGGLILSGGKTL